jgi:hypothetical protein
MSFISGYDKRVVSLYVIKISHNVFFENYFANELT